MRHHEPYPHYKHSGIEWIGEIPEHWKIAQLGKLAISRCDGPFGSGLKSEHYTESGVRVVRLQNIGIGEFKNGDAAYISVDHWYDTLGGGHEVLPNDILIAGLGDDNNPLGRACVAPTSIGEAIVKADCYRFRLGKRVAPEFVALALSATARAECGFLATGATRDRLNLTLASARKIPVPPPDEQLAIAGAIGRETARIDALIAKKSRFMDLVSEKILAMASLSVEIPGVEWVRLEYASDVISRPVLQSNDESYTRLGLYNHGRGIFRKQEADNEDMGDSDFFWVEEGDLILSGQFAWEGAVALATGTHKGCVVSHRFPIIRGRDGVALTEFIYALLRTDYGDFILND